jgi:Cytochrome P450
MRFAKMQSKMALYTILQNFEILESPLTAYPPTFDPKIVLLLSKDDIFVQLKAT